MKPGEGGAGLVGLTRGAGLGAGVRALGVGLDVGGGGADALTQAPSAGINPTANAI